MREGNETKMEDILVAAGLISAEELQTVKDMELKTGERLDKLLLSEGIINYREILQYMAEKMGVEFVDLENTKVNREAILALNAATAHKYNVFPFDVKADHLFLAMQNPDDIFLIDEIKMHAQMEIKPFLADSRLIKKAVNYFYSEDAPPECAVCAEEPMDPEMDIISGTRRQDLPKGNISPEGNGKVCMEDFINVLIKKSLVAENISDIHIDPIGRNVTVTLKFRY